ncbi:MAG: peptidyl-prolyl cis-trans isomerase, partial [Pseudomonadota bacterium]
RRNGMTVRDFEESIRGQTSSAILQNAVAGGIETPGVFIDTLFNYALEARDVTWARLTADDLAEPVAEPTDADLRSFHEENQEPFTLGETRVIDYAWLSPEDVADEIEVDEARLRELYQDNIAEFVLPERRLVERLVYAVEADAAAAKARLDSGEVTFEALVEERGLSLSDVDMGEVEASDLDAAADAVFGIAEPGVVGPAPSSVGPALYRVNAILSAQETTFEEVRDDLAAEASADRARRLINDRIGQVEDLLAGGASVADLAERTEMVAGSIDWRSEVTDGIAAYQGFRQAAARLQQGDFAEVVRLDDGGIVVPALREILPPALQTFENVEAEVAALWLQQATEDALTAQAEGLAEDLRNGAEMAGLDLALETDRGLSRDGFVAGTPPDFTSQVFEMEAGDVRVLSADGDAWLVRLDTVTPPDATTAEAELQRLQFADATAQDLSRSLLSAFTQSVLDTTDVDVNPSAMNLVIQSTQHGGM